MNKQFLLFRVHFAYQALPGQRGKQKRKCVFCAKLLACVFLNIMDVHSNEGRSRILPPPPNAADGLAVCSKESLLLLFVFLPLLLSSWSASGHGWSTPFACTQVAKPCAKGTQNSTTRGSQIPETTDIISMRAMCLSVCIHRLCV